MYKNMNSKSILYIRKSQSWGAKEVKAENVKSLTGANDFLQVKGIHI